ncbi:MAG: hypothetical protein IT566_17815 [Rhodospirillaceae bacterium]|nr:hypothetical protein [Rhodospirillaceae bacterium]
MQSAPWRLDIRPRRFASLIAVAIIWIVCGPLIAWGIAEKQGIMFVVICSAFPLLITYYGLQSTLRDAGHVSVDREGFFVRRPGGETKRFAWHEIRRFFVGTFGASPVYEGQPVAHFEVVDNAGNSREEWLPGNLGLSPMQLMCAMEKLRKLAQQGWPSTPCSIQELIGD